MATLNTASAVINIWLTEAQRKPGTCRAVWGCSQWFIRFIGHSYLHWTTRLLTFIYIKVRKDYEKFNASANNIRTNWNIIFKYMEMHWKKNPFKKETSLFKYWKRTCITRTCTLYALSICAHAHALSMWDTRNNRESTRSLLLHHHHHVF